MVHRVRAIIDSRMLSGKKWITGDDDATHLFDASGNASCKSYMLPSVVVTAAKQSFKKVCASCLDVADADDLITKQRTNERPYREYSFPELTRCSRCGSNTGVKFHGARKLSSSIANNIELIAFGLQMKDWDNPMPKQRLCECDVIIPMLMDRLECLKVKSDTGWIGSRVGRCITDYVRNIEFVTDPTVEQLRDVVQLFTYIDCPGWTKINHSKKGRTYEFVTTFDSSD